MPFSAIRSFLIVLLLIGSVLIGDAQVATTPPPMKENRDSLYSLDEVVVSENLRKKEHLTPISANFASSQFFRKNITDSFTATIANIPGVRSMSIGNGFGKPIIRGFGFNRIAYISGSTKQATQAWGSDHGLEVDNFEDLPVEIVKGPRSLLYGSDALGGAIVTSLPQMPIEKGLRGSLTLLGSSINGGFGASLLLGYRFSNAYLRIRFSEQHFGDKNVLTDSIRYLDRNIPIAKRRMKNTAGYSRAWKSSYEWKKNGFSSYLEYSDLYQKAGFFPGAHGIPDLKRLTDDKNRYNTDLPFSAVKHQKIQIRESYTNSDNLAGNLEIAYQHNLRREYSLFHTHYPSQPLPSKDPNKEIEMNLHSINARSEITYYAMEGLKILGVLDGAFRHQSIDGYGFLIPSYRFASVGAGVVGSYKPNEQYTIEGGIRYDWGKMDAKESKDPYLTEFLASMGMSAEDIANYSVRSYPIHRHFSSFSGSISLAYSPSREHTLKMAICRGFRFPEINELAINGVHHGSFRHDRGDRSLNPEHSWQLSMGYLFNKENIIDLRAELFGNYFSNFIYGTPTGDWSPLPHAGQIFQYRQNRVVIGGGEVEVKYYLPLGFYIEGSAEVALSKNIDRHIPLPFTPPARLKATAGYRNKIIESEIRYRYIAKADHIVPGEEITPSAQLVDFSLSASLPFMGIRPEITLTIENIFNTRYFDHLAFYRRIGLPEAGRNARINIRIPF